MNTDCVNCKHARLWTDKEQFEYIERMFNSIGRMPCRADHYICDKIPKGKEWTEDGNTYSYDGYSLDGENYDEVFHCFEPQESEDIVWYCKTLQNWKALASTTLTDGMYYELTLNGDKQELYLDAYKKFENKCIKLESEG